MNDRVTQTKAALPTNDLAKRVSGTVAEEFDAQGREIRDCIVRSLPENFDFASGQLPDRLIGNRLPIPYIACVQLSWMRFIGLFVRVRQLLFYPLKNCRGDQQVAPTEYIWSLRPLLQMSVVRVRQCLPASCG